VRWHIQFGDLLLLKGFLERNATENKKHEKKTCSICKKQLSLSRMKKVFKQLCWSKEKLSSEKKT